MKILIPLGGIGQRFSDANYTTPKPLIKVLGKPILFWVIDNLNLTDEDELYITYNESLDKHNLGNIIKSKYPNIKTKSVPNTRGAAETIRLAIEHFFKSDDKLEIPSFAAHYIVGFALSIVRNKQTNIRLLSTRTLHT